VEVVNKNRMPCARELGQSDSDGALLEVIGICNMYNIADWE
jgi:hypothetical protein